MHDRKRSFAIMMKVGPEKLSDRTTPKNFCYRQSCLSHLDINESTWECLLRHINISPGSEKERYFFPIMSHVDSGIWEIITWSDFYMKLCYSWKINGKSKNEFRTSERGDIVMTKNLKSKYTCYTIYNKNNFPGSNELWLIRFIHYYVGLFSLSFLFYVANWEKMLKQETLTNKTKSKERQLVLY